MPKSIGGLPNTYMYSIVLDKMFSEKKKIFETFFGSEVSVFTALTVCNNEALKNVEIS
jgi:hypothetical protein